MITVEFMTQVKAEAGCARMDLDASRAMPVSSVLGAVIERMPTLQSLLVDEEGCRHGWLMVSIDDVLIPRDHDPEVPLGSRVLLATPISGG
jgi:molybdopterin converting factor small subunit